MAVHFRLPDGAVIGCVNNRHAAQGALSRDGLRYKESPAYRRAGNWALFFFLGGGNMSRYSRYADLTELQQELVRQQWPDLDWDEWIIVLDWRGNPARLVEPYWKN